MFEKGDKVTVVKQNSCYYGKEGEIAQVEKPKKCETRGHIRVNFAGKHGREQARYKEADLLKNPDCEQGGKATST
ncbi:MAG: hypothetical protein WC470_01445 [Candidatus Paceibacterota bacterium]